MTSVARLTTAAVTMHGEGPAWSDRWRGLRFVDMLAGDVLELREDGEIARRHVGEVAAVVRARRRGGWLVVTQHRVLLSDSDALDGDLAEGPELWTDPAVRANEGECDPSGVLRVGAMAWDAEPGRGTMVRVGADLRPEVERTGLGVSNGLAWTADGSRAYFADTLAGVVEEHRWSPERGLHDARPWAVVPGADGLATDLDGGVWVAQFGRGAVVRFDASGVVVERVELPVRQPTSLAFGGVARDRLFVTTSRYRLDDPEPGAGALIEIEGHGTRGVPLGEFAG